MKKLAPVLVLTILLTMVFVSCGKDEEETTTVLTTQPVASTVEAVSETETSAEGYVLTTKPGDTMPSIATTAYVSETDVDMSALTGGTVTAPVVVTDYVTTVEVPTLTTTAAADLTAEGDETTEDMNGTEASTTTQINEEYSNNESTGNSSDETTASTTEGSSATNKKLVVVGTANDDKGNVTIMFDYDGWDRIKSQKARATVTVNGKSRLVQGTVNGVDDNGQFSFTVDLSEKFTSLSSGDYITMKFAKGAIETIGGGQKSAATQTSLYYE